jgi:Protein of unknown function (DUF3830)
MSITEHVRSTGIAKAASNSGRFSIRTGDLNLFATWEAAAAPKTCTLFQTMLPMRMKMIHCSWSGEGVWVPLEMRDGQWQEENATSHPSPGQLLLYMGEQSEPELLIPCGICIFNSKAGVLKGNHFATISEKLDRLLDLHRLILWQGAQDCTIEKIAAG